MAAKAPQTDSPLPAKLLDEARRLGVDTAGRTEDEVRQRVRKAWIEENREAIDGWNAWVEKHGLPLAKYRLNAVKPLEPELKQLGLRNLYLFGSVARGEAGGNEVDFLYEVEGERRPGFMQLTGALARLEDVLGGRVDLVERQRLHPRIRPRVEADMVEIF